MSSVMVAPPAQVAQLTSTQKVAAVLLAVGQEAAGPVLAHLNDMEVESVALEIATMGQVPAEVLEQVLEEFYQEAVARGHLISGGEEKARELLRQWRGNEGDEIVDRLLATVRTTPFYFLRGHEPSSLVQHLIDEQPQTIALVLAYLPPKFAAQILSGLEPHTQGEVARRIASMEPTSPDVVSAVEAALQARLGEIRRTEHTERGGVKELAAMLNNADRGTERAILGELEESDPGLAEEVRGLMFVFEDITSLDDRAVQEILRAVEVARLAVALKGVNQDVKDKIVENLSERARESLSEEIDLLGPVRVSDVEGAQTEVVRVIRQLEEDGTIAISRGGDGEFVE